MSSISVPRATKLVDQPAGIGDRQIFGPIDPEPAPQPGMALQAQSPDGQPMTLYVLEVGEESVKADGNHPLAGEDLTFDITLRDIKQAA